MQGIFKSFVSEKEIDEIKQKRQEEWEKVRRPDQPLQRPEEAIDHRTLYERLKEQKDRKQEEFMEQLKFKNMIYKGLDDEEASFLTFIAQRQADQETEMIKREIEEVHSFRDAVAKLQDEEGLATIQQSSSSSSQAQSDPLTSSSSSSGSKPKQKSKQLALIAGSIKTKRKRSQSSSDVDGDKDGDTSSRDKEIASPVATSPEKKQKLDSESLSNTTTQKPPDPASSVEQAGRSRQPSTSQALSGLMAYSSSSEEEDDS